MSLPTLRDPGRHLRLRGLLGSLADCVKVLLAPRGRHRAGRHVRQVVTASPLVMSAAPPRPPVAATVRHWYEPLDGGASPLVRPYLVAWEGEERSRSRRDIHRTLEPA